MTKFDLYCLIFNLLDAESTDSPEDEQLAQFVSDADPHQGLEANTAKPEIYRDFEDKILCPIVMDNSFSLAQNYLYSLNMDGACRAIDAIDEPSWREIVRDFFNNSEHLDLKA